MSLKENRQFEISSEIESIYNSIQVPEDKQGQVFSLQRISNIKNKEFLDLVF